MSHNTTTPETLREPLVIRLSQPLQPGSAVERWLWDMFIRGLVDVSTSDRTPQGGDTAPSRNRRTQAGADVSSSDSEEATAYSTDMAFSEDTTYSSDSIHGVAGKGIAIAAGVNKGSSYTKGKRITLQVLRNVPLKNQRYLMHIRILDQPVADIEDFSERYGEFLDEANCVLELDCGSNTTWILGYNCRELLIKPSSTVGGSTTYSMRPWGAGTSSTRTQPLGERAVILDHAYIRGSNLPAPDDLTTGIVRYADNTGAAVLLHDQTLKISIRCYNWFEKSWKGTMLLDYKPAVAYAVTSTFCDRPRMSGILSLGLMRRQSAFGGAVNRLQAPAFLETLQNYIPPVDDGGIVVYFALRPTTLYQSTTTGYQLLDREAEHWISFNQWPCKLEPLWSRSIYLVPEGEHWRVRLLSMTFQRYNKDKSAYESFDDSDAGTITFGDQGLLVHLDCGASVTLVPPSLVRHIRTKLWPTAENQKIDAEYQDTPCSLANPAVPFYVPNYEVIGIVYKFADGRGNTVEVNGPGNYFFGQPNPQRASNSKDKEGLIFVGPPDVLRGEVIFGMNFFQTMFVAFHNPGDGDPYVRLAPQWESQMVQFSPRHKVDSNV